MSKEERSALNRIRLTEDDLLRNKRDPVKAAQIQAKLQRLRKEYFLQFKQALY